MPLTSCTFLFKHLKKDVHQPTSELRLHGILGMILQPGEKIHVVHRRLFEKDLRKHFIGVVEAYETGLVRATGHIWVIEDPKVNIFKRHPEPRTRILALHGGTLMLNVLPPMVDLEQVQYEHVGCSIRVTDGAGWFLDLKEFGWA